MPTHTLITSERSPFGRICRMFMTTHQIPFQLQILNFIDDKQDATVLSQESPINKVPILVVDGSQKIFDSRVIMNYLIKQHRVKELSLEEENFVSAIYSCLDVSVILFLMKMSGYDLDAQNIYLSRQKDRIPRNLEYLKSWASELSPENPNDWNYASMSLFSFLYWTKVRARTVQLEEYPHFQRFLDLFANAPGVKESAFNTTHQII